MLARQRRAALQLQENAAPPRPRHFFSRPIAEPLRRTASFAAGAAFTSLFLFQQAFGQQPKFTFKAEGWRAIEVERPKDYRYWFNNEATYSSMRVSPESARLDNAPIVDTAGGKIRFSFPLEPRKPNRVVFWADSASGDNWWPFVYLDTVLVPKTYIVRSGNTILLMDDGSLAAKARTLADDVESFNSAIRRGRKQTVVLIPSILPSEEAAAESNVEASFNPFDSTVTATKSLLDKPVFLAPTAFHEMAHSFYDIELADLGKEHAGVLVENYVLMMRRTPCRPYPPLSVPRSGLENHPLVSMFDESSYFLAKGVQVDSAYGHPYDNDSELFASASSVLRFFPREFFARLLRLEKTDKRAAELARKIAIDVLRAYGSRPLFPAEAYTGLGLTHPAARVQVPKKQ
jgi:hypothetical protein